MRHQQSRAASYGQDAPCGRPARAGGPAVGRTATAPFDFIIYTGPVGAVKVYGRRRMGASFDRVIASLQCRLAAESEAGLARGMHYPMRWDPPSRTS